ncbi:MAG TPA: class IV adenylate cyclase [Candidatus Nanoarchaeia archaeon]|nr:class IV adenylate cyclase [Candidatus Nanoarchaeia archaeon]
MKEVEVKILEVNRTQIEKALTALGAQKIFDGLIHTLLFDFDDCSIIRAKDVLRLRKEENRTELTYKKVSFTETAKIAEEYTVEISSLETMKKVLENLGLSVIENLQKHRTSYTLNHARFDIDHYLEEFEYIPDFLEIEAENTDMIYKYAELLGFSPEKCLPWSTNDIIKYYARKTRS